MSIISHLDPLLNELCKPALLSTAHREQLIGLIDLTLLEKQATADELGALFNKAIEHQVAAICVFPEHLPSSWSATGVKKATVINFPEGQDHLEESLSQLDHAIGAQADEIDYVFDYRAWLRGDKASALSACERIIHQSQARGLTTKIILETGAFENIEEIYSLSTDVIALGCDFIKTSTGKITQGASPSAATAMLAAISDSNPSCGIKLSGGIRRTDQAMNYLFLAEKILHKRADASWFRIGASSLLKELI